MESWKKTNIDAGLLVALVLGFTAAIVVGIGAVGWVDDRIDARVADAVERSEERIVNRLDRIDRQLRRIENYNHR